MSLKVERWAEWGFFHDHTFPLKYHFHNSNAVCFDMQPYKISSVIIWRKKMDLKLNFELSYIALIKGKQPIFKTKLSM